MKVNEKFSMLLILEKSKKTKEGKSPITIRITVDCKRSELSLGQKINEELWNQDAGVVKGNSQEARQINAYIDKAKARLRQVYDQLSGTHDYVSAAMVKDAYQGKKKETKTLLETVDFVVGILEKKVTTGHRASGTLKRWKVTRNKVVAFVRYQYNVSDILLTDIKYAFAEDFINFLMLEQRMESNTAMKYLTNTKQVIKTAVDRNWLIKNPLSGYKCKYVNPDRDILSEGEIQKFYHKTLPLARLREVRDIYLFMCFTGYAYKDVCLLTPDHVVKFFDGEDWIVKNREKTWCRENVPLLPIAKKIIQKYSDHPYCRVNNVLLPVNSNQKFNAYLKEVSELCGISKNLTTHTARHTFATTVTLSNGVPLETVSALLGHKSIRTTQIYAKIVAQKISDDMSMLKEKLQGKMLCFIE
ncbi:MAG TPA: site-specific integrase [Chitinophagaceae bacterium]|nr:site-specific integrase [Chitinophagaceae bacterium]